MNDSYIAGQSSRRIREDKRGGDSRRLSRLCPPHKQQQRWREDSQLFVWGKMRGGISQSVGSNFLHFGAPAMPLTIKESNTD